MPRVPSSRIMVPEATSSRPWTATTHGMPNWRAMIAVWLVGPPRVVARPTTRCGSRPAVSAGARSSAHRIDGSTGSGTPGSGQTGEFGDDAVADVLQVGDPFGHQAAHLGEHLDELSGRVIGRPDGGLAGLDGVFCRPKPGPVCRQLRGGGENLRGRTRR